MNAGATTSDRRHPLLLGGGQQRRERRGPVQHRVLGVNVQVNELVRHGSRVSLGVAGGGKAPVWTPVEVTVPPARSKSPVSQPSAATVSGWLPDEVSTG